MSMSDLFEPLAFLHGPQMRNRFMLAPLTNQQSELDGAAADFDQEWNRARLTIEVIEGIRRACGPDFQIGWRLSIERYGLLLEELRDVVSEILRRELIDYLDLALWDSAQIVGTGTFRGKTMLSVSPVFLAGASASARRARS